MSKNRQSKHRGRRRHLVALAAISIAFVLAATFAIVTLRHGGPPGSDAAVAAAGQPSPFASDPWFRQAFRPPVTPTPTPALIGGDNPSLYPGPPPGVIPIAENVGVSPDFSALLNSLQEEIEGYRQREGRIDVAVAVTDLQTGETISVNGNVLHKTGCTINLFALLVAVDAFQQGEARPGDVAYSIRVGIGGSYPPQVKRFLQAIKGSHVAGVERARELMRAWGLQSSLFDHVPYYGDGTQNNYLTALEANLILSKLYRGELFPPEWTQYALERLRDVRSYLNYILPGRLPAGVTVAHKIGYHWDYDGWVNNDAGIVTFPGEDGQEKAYVITYLSQQARTEYNGYSFGARLSRLVWDYFAAKYGAQVSPLPPLPPLASEPISAPSPASSPPPPAA